MALRKKTLILVFVPGLLYLAFSAIVPEQYRVSHEFKAGPQTALRHAAVSGAGTLGDLLARPDTLFENPAVLGDLSKRLWRVMPFDRGADLNSSVHAYVQDHMRLESVGPSSVAVVYAGRELPVGRMLANFYAQQLIQQLDAPGLRLSILPDVELSRALWRCERLVPAVWITVFSLFVLLLIVILIEWMDPSLKTVRQASRYLEVPVLGFIPDLQRLNEVLKPDSPAPGAGRA